MMNKPKNSVTKGNGYQSVSKPKGMSTGSGHGATNPVNNRTASRGKSSGCSPAVGLVK